ncbi:TM2 domain-containing protein 2 isoform X2 [Bombina bombina]|uniref:TM2 domain-containing protein 2 isoform X2 n=1 Tax=Bombina bombina TaxID=8345 RepID=UPI00235A6169|nr:TM2 domain-containing protein 2 isoform X2 [Bombina bombina]
MRCLLPPLGYLLLGGQGLLLTFSLISSQNNTDPRPFSETNNISTEPRDPRGPLVLCTFIPEEFIECDDPVDHVGNGTAQQDLGYGCRKFGGQAYGEVEHTQVMCRVLEGIECAGPRTFLRGNKPCINSEPCEFRIPTMIKP